MTPLIPVGKVVLEKILRTFSQVKTIYISITSKGVSTFADSKGNFDLAYNRYEKEIKNSEIFDTLKIDLGWKAWSKLMKKKIKLVIMDLGAPNLGLTP